MLLQGAGYVILLLLLLPCAAESGLPKCALPFALGGG